MKTKIEPGGDTVWEFTEVPSRDDAVAICKAEGYPTYWTSRGGVFYVVRPQSVLLDEDICGLCGEPGADKIPHPIHWPGERQPDTELVHAYCEHEECARAHAALPDQEREAFLRSVAHDI